MLITAHDSGWACITTPEASGFDTSVIMASVEAGVEDVLGAKAVLEGFHF
jgi:formylmethanofuran:tetrahydromethanopterin formyltransferase